MPLFYNTNGFAHHRLEDVVDLLADLGYDGVALTPDVHHLDPLRATAAEIDRFAAHLARRRLGVTIEGGARFVLDPRRKHWPTLLTTVEEGFRRRQELDVRLLTLAERVGASIVSIWSGSAEDDTPSGAGLLELLAGRLEPALEAAAARGITLAFEPEPGMAIERVADAVALGERVATGGHRLGLTIDLGHLAAVEDPPWDAILRSTTRHLVNVHADDAPRGRHEHVFFGEGDLDLPSLSLALREVGYRGPVAVELSRHSHDAPRTAERALRALKAAGFGS